LAFAGKQVENGVFTPNAKEVAVLDKQLAELTELAVALRPLQNR